MGSIQAALHDRKGSGTAISTFYKLVAHYMKLVPFKKMFGPCPSMTLSPPLRTVSTENSPNSGESELSGFIQSLYVLDSF